MSGNFFGIVLRRLNNEHYVFVKYFKWDMRLGDANSLAVHLNKYANSGYRYFAETQPLAGCHKCVFDQLIYPGLLKCSECGNHKQVLVYEDY